jgi:hypothetical protein
MKRSTPSVRPLALALLVVALAAGAGRADDSEVRTKFEGQLAYKTALDTNWDPVSRDPWWNDVYAFAAASAAWGANFGARAAGLFEYRLDVGKKAQGLAIPELRELYGKVRLGKLDVFFGQQITSWAATDVFSVIDRLNPYDYSRVLDSELPYARLGTPMIRPVLYLDPVQLEAAYLPLFTPSRFNIVGNDWALVGRNFPLGYLFHDMATSQSWQRELKLIDQWVPQWQNTLQVLLNDPGYYADHTQLPDQNLLAPQAAARVKFTSSAIDVSAAYYYIWDDLPTLHLNPLLSALQRETLAAGPNSLPPFSPSLLTSSAATAPFELTYHRLQTAGLGLSSSVYNIGLRADGGVDIGRWHYRTDFTAAQRTQARWSFNADYTFAHDVFFEAVLLQAFLFDRDPSFLERAWTNVPGFALRAPFLAGKFQWESIVLVDLSYMRDRDWRHGQIFHSGWVVGPMLTYSITDPLRVSVGANLLGGANYTLIGQMSGNSRVFTEVRWGF